VSDNPLKKIISLPLHYQIGIAMALGIFLGYLTGGDSPFLPAGVESMDPKDPNFPSKLGFMNAAYDFLATIFMRALQMIMVPLLVCAIITGVLSVGKKGGFGRLGLRTLAYYLATSFLAILTGLFFVNLIEPGVVETGLGKEIFTSMDPSEKIKQMEGRGGGDLIQIFVRMIPINPINAAANGDMLSIIFFSLLLGFFIASAGRKAKDLANFFKVGFDVMMKLTGFIIRFTPIGVLGLIARVTAESGLETFVSLLTYMGTVLAALAVHFFVTLPLALKFLTRRNPMEFYKAISPAILTAFSTASSSATLPVNMNAIEKRAGISSRTSSFVLPLGATINMDGTALYECVAVMFIAQLYGVDLSFAEQLVVAITALLASIGAAGIPSAGVVMMGVVLTAVGLPLEGVGFILAVDRVLDMCRTAVNVTSDATGAAILDTKSGK